jgi:mannose-6-phosphate isomerase-like protein (cupin superfamily)
MIHCYVPDAKDEGIKNKNSRFLAIDFILPIEELNVAEIKLSERYPVWGFARNAKSKMIVRVIKGEVLFVCENESTLLPKDSVVLVETNKAYAWEPKPDVTLYIVSTPAWTPEQAELVD